VLATHARPRETNAIVRVVAVGASSWAKVGEGVSLKAGVPRAPAPIKMAQAGFTGCALGRSLNRRAIPTDAVPSMSAMTALTYPLSAWTRPLTAAERALDVAAGPEIDWVALALAGIHARDRDPLRRSDMLPKHWLPSLPNGVPSCYVCGLPELQGLCQRCRVLLNRFDWSIESIDYLAVSSKRDFLEQLIWTWKRSAEISRRLRSDPSDELESIAAGLSAYFEQHQDRLLAGISLITAVPSRVPLMGTALALAERRGWFSVPVQPSGRKTSQWFQHASHAGGERLARSSADWAIDADVVDGQYVLVLDDLFVSGASMLSYVQALRSAGATPLRCVALARHVGDRHWNYWDALRIVRRAGDYEWNPERAVPRLGTRHVLAASG
jgi:adenine/guanine phosphoribosyltransferase-like PRPP-binding protein